MASLDHPHIARVYDVNSDAKLPYLVMELVTGGTLADWQTPPRTHARRASPRGASVRSRSASSRRTRPASSTATSSRRTCSSTADGTCKLTDFGIARMEDSHVRPARAPRWAPRGTWRPSRRKTRARSTCGSTCSASGCCCSRSLTNEDRRGAARRARARPAADAAPVTDRSRHVVRPRSPPADRAGVPDRAVRGRESCCPPIRRRRRSRRPRCPAKRCVLDGLPISGGEDSTLMRVEQDVGDAGAGRVERRPTRAPRPALHDEPLARARGGCPRGPPRGCRTRASPPKRDNVDITLERPQARDADGGARTRQDAGRRVGAVGRTRQRWPAEEAARRSEDVHGSGAHHDHDTVLDPWRVALPPFILVVTPGRHLPVIQSRPLRRQAEEARVARTELEQTVRRRAAASRRPRRCWAPTATLETLYAAGHAEGDQTPAVPTDGGVPHGGRKRAPVPRGPGNPVYESAKGACWRIRGARSGVRDRDARVRCAGSNGFSWGIEP